MNKFDQKRIVLYKDLYHSLAAEVDVLKKRLESIEQVISKLDTKSFRPENILLFPSKRNFSSILESPSAKMKKELEDIYKQQKKLVTQLLEIDREELISIKYGDNNS